MICPKCRESLEASAIKIHCVAPTSVEVQLPCKCGEVYSHWLEHTGWADASSEPADLTEFKPRTKGRTS